MSEYNYNNHEEYDPDMDKRIAIINDVKSELKKLLGDAYIYAPDNMKYKIRIVKDTSDPDIYEEIDIKGDASAIYYYGEDPIIKKFVDTYVTPHEKLANLNKVSLLKGKLPKNILSSIGEYVTGMKGNINKEKKILEEKIGGKRRERKTRRRRNMKKRKMSRKNRKLSRKN
jgi:hypothetical protein